MEPTMNYFLKFAHAIDWVNEGCSKLAAWAVLITAMVCAGHAFVRYGFNMGSNGWLELQWYLFAVVVMLGAPYVLKANEHVRVDLIYGKLPGRAPVYIDLFGLIFFLLPVIGFLLYLSAPYFYQAWLSGEKSQSAGGLVRWPVILTLPVGFFLLLMQGISEIIKRIAYLAGRYEMDTHYEKPVQ
jgi:TRAP-type mannitol/chloroaromatic compound transport system permease small subunit